MMDETEIKHELPNFDYQCRVCLSVGRRMSPLGKYTDVFRKIASDLENQKHDLSDNVRLCWECISVLRKVYVFQQQLRRAQAMLCVGEYLFGSLSSLTTITLNETHTNTVYMYKTNIETDIKPVEHDDHGDRSDHCDDDGQADDCGDLKNEEVIIEVSMPEPKKPKSNRWATKRALQNKKQKFKIITDNTGDGFNKIQIKNEDLSSYLKSQRESEYFKSKRYKCSKCVLTFIDERTLTAHDNKYHSKGIYTCDICDSNLPNKRHLVKHMHKHYYKFGCQLCSFTCYDKSQRQWHYQKMHKRVFQCIKCGLKFGCRKEFFKHYKEWHEKFICDYCGVSFKMRYCIKNHIRKQHSPFECVPCNKRFARYNGLWLHNKTSHATNNDTAYCVECDRRYRDVYRYKWHLANSARHNRRTTIRVPCPSCDKVFSKNIYMKDHYNLVHLKYYKYRCEQCDKNFIRNADLVKHTRRVHEGILPPKNKICYMCGRAFSTNKILANHMRTHTGERPHACAVCGARFAQSTTLAAHARAIHRTAGKQS